MKALIRHNPFCMLRPRDNMNLCRSQMDSCYGYRSMASSHLRFEWIMAYSIPCSPPTTSEMLLAINTMEKSDFLKPISHSQIQSTLVISTSVISNNRLSRRENLVLVLTQKSKIRIQNIVEKRRNCSWGAIFPLFHNIFNIYF